MVSKIARVCGPTKYRISTSDAKYNLFFAKQKPEIEIYCRVIL